jgi:phosphoribosylaminoimidazole-succinocarboxamide synthase
VDDRQTLVKKVQIIPVEVVVRNVIAGSLSKRVGVEEGVQLAEPIIELYYKNDELHDPMINAYHARVMGWATAEQLQEIDRQGAANQPGTEIFL